MHNANLIVLALCAGAFLSAQSSAQVGQAFGSTSGSYCKFKKDDKIEVDTWLPLDSSPDYAWRMTLRRLAEMTQSKGLSTFVADKDACGVLAINRKPTNLRCKAKAQMERETSANGTLEAGRARFNVEEVMRLTQHEAASYPRRTGLLNYKNQCVIT